MAEVGELLGERERAACNAMLDSLEVLPRPAQVAFAWRSQQGGAVSHALVSEVEANSIGACLDDPSGE